MANEIDPKAEYDRQEQERKKRQTDERESTNHAIPKDATLMQHARGLSRVAGDMIKGVAIPSNRAIIRTSRYVKKNYVDPKLAERKAIKEAYRKAEHRAKINAAKQSARQKVGGGGTGSGLFSGNNRNNFALGGGNQFTNNKKRKKGRWF